MTDDYTSSYPRPEGGASTAGVPSAPGVPSTAGVTPVAGTTTTAGATTTATGTTTAGTTSTADTAKQQASNLKDKAAGAGEHLLGEAKGEAAAVTQEARRQLGDLWSQARSEVSQQAGTQQSRLAGGLTSVGGQLSQMASAPAEQNLATDIVREVGDRVDSLGRWLESHGPDEVLDEVRAFARRRPGTFLLVAAGAGMVLGRLTRGLKDAPSTSPRSTTPVRTATTEQLPVYTDVVEDRPRFTDDLATPVPGSAPTWDPR